MKYVIATALVWIGFVAVASAQDLAGEYVCEVRQKAGISSVHLEGAGPPEAFVSQEVPTRFAMRLTGPGIRRDFLIVETPYAGPNRDRHEWQTQNSILHAAYQSDDGRDFRAAEDQGFMRIGPRQGGGLWFYHAGFEYAGGEDVHLSVRWGACDLRS